MTSDASSPPPPPSFATPDAGEMAAAAPGIVGKTIAHVVVKKRPGQPRSQLFLVFTDGTYYEFFSPDGDLEGSSAIDRGGLDDVRRYQSDQWIVLQASAPVTHTGERPSRRDLKAPL
ncbi:MAG: hypothetical protein OEY20_10040 [Gemmatimonadota bacterium]|nr:hypothetical protein [Gemmatimonadota bacterium]